MDFRLIILYRWLQQKLTYEPFPVVAKLRFWLCSWPKKISGLRKIACHCRISASKGANLLYLISECTFQYKFVRGCVCMPVYLALTRPMQRNFHIRGRNCHSLGENLSTLGGECFHIVHKTGQKVREMQDTAKHALKSRRLCSFMIFFFKCLVVAYHIKICHSKSCGALFI